MAKDGKSKTKIPKTVAGIKLPKKLRKAGNKAVKLAQDPIVGEVVAAALLSAAAALRDGGATQATNKASSGGGDDAKRQPNPLGDSLKLLAVDFARRALEGFEDGRRTKNDGGPGASGQRSGNSAD